MTTRHFYMRADRSKWPTAGLEHVLAVDVDADTLAGARACYRQLRAKWPAQEARAATLAILRCGTKSEIQLVTWPRHPQLFGAAHD